MAGGRVVVVVVSDPGDSVYRSFYCPCLGIEFVEMLENYQTSHITVSEHDFCCCCCFSGGRTDVLLLLFNKSSYIYFQWFGLCCQEIYQIFKDLKYTPIVGHTDIT